MLVVSLAELQPGIVQRNRLSSCKARMGKVPPERQRRATERGAHGVNAISHASVGPATPSCTHKPSSAFYHLCLYSMTLLFQISGLFTPFVSLAPRANVRSHLGPACRSGRGGRRQRASLLFGLRTLEPSKSSARELASAFLDFVFIAVFFSFLRQLQ